ncbi:MAG TPA: YdeI/OmpD-associated family protein, partial [Myxococcales bacterium]|nr:YdeI/OmpD-associated family protein [Myxococcales bacterium]
VELNGVLTPNQPAVTYVPLTREQSERFPGAGIVRVKGTVGGFAIQSSLMPMGDGTRCLGVHKATMEQGGFHHGDVVKVAIRLDTSPREVVVPKDFLEALEKSPKARRTFANYAFTHRKEYVTWIEEAKQPETRQRRIDQAVRMIEAHETLS